MTLCIKDGREQVSRPHVIDCGTAYLHVSAHGLATILRVDGEIDAYNAEPLAGELRRFARLQSPIVLDCSHLKFIGIAGFRALLMIVDEQRHSRRHCSVIAGAAMRPLLRVITDHGLPLVASFPEALQLIDDIAHAHRQFLSGIVGQRQPRFDSPVVASG